MDGAIENLIVKFAITKKENKGFFLKGNEEFFLKIKLEVYEISLFMFNLIHYFHKKISFK